MTRTFASLIALALFVATAVAESLPDCRMTDAWKTRHGKKDRKCGDLKTKKLQKSLCKKIFKKKGNQATGFQACPHCSKCAGPPAEAATTTTAAVESVECVQLDSSGWFADDAAKTCSWVADDTETRCDTRNAITKVRAAEACPICRQCGSAALQLAVNGTKTRGNARTTSPVPCSAWR